MSPCPQCLGLRVTSTGKACNRCKPGLAVRVALEGASDDERRLTMAQVLDAADGTLRQRLRYLEGCGTSSEVRPFGRVMSVEDRQSTMSTWSKRRAALAKAREQLFAEAGDP